MISTDSDVMNNYHLLVRLLYLKDQNLPPFKEARVNRINSTKKVISLIQNCFRTTPIMPLQLASLSENDRSPPSNPSRVGRRHGLP